MAKNTMFEGIVRTRSKNFIPARNLACGIFASKALGSLGLWKGGDFK
jgi:hypothetical protein